jgi:hypothetical protein
MIRIIKSLNRRRSRGAVCRRISSIHVSISKSKRISLGEHYNIIQKCKYKKNNTITLVVVETKSYFDLLREYTIQQRKGN